MTATKKTKAQQWAEKEPDERVKTYGTMVVHLRGVAELLRAQGAPAGEVRLLHLAARNMAGASAAVLQAEELAKSCCWQAVQFGSCKCATLAE